MNEASLRMIRDDFRDWLLDNGYAEEMPGYGHVTADDLADAVMARWFKSDDGDEAPTNEHP